MSVRRSLIPLLLLAGVTAAALSCRDTSPVGIDLAAPSTQQGKHDQYAQASAAWSGYEIASGTWSGLVPCHQKYDSVTRVIGPAGGLILVGPHVLYIAAMALSDTVTITAVAPSDTVRWVRFEPDGLQFQTNDRGRSALLYTRYGDCAVSPSDLFRIAQVNDSLQIIEYLASPDWSRPDRYAVGVLHHFSQYAVSW